MVAIVNATILNRNLAKRQRRVLYQHGAQPHVFCTDDQRAGRAGPFATSTRVCPNILRKSSNG